MNNYYGELEQQIAQAQNERDSHACAVELELYSIRAQMNQDQEDYETSLDLFFTPLFEDIEDTLAKYSYEDVEVMNSLECLEYLLSR